MFLKTSIHIFIFVYYVVYYLLWMFFDNGVTVSIVAPDSIKPGESVMAEVIIKKGTIGGFAKLQLEVGQGISIIEDDNRGAAFSFSNNTAKWIWTALPMESEFKVRFKVNADPTASGDVTISGKFSYIINNTKQVVEIPSKNIKIGTSLINVAQNSRTSSPTSTNTSNTSTMTSITNTDVSTPINTIVVSNSQIPVSTTTTSITDTSMNIDIKREIKNIAPDVWLVNIEIKKSNIQGFARYSDVLPTGLKAKVEKKDESSFFVDGHSIKFVWSNLPAKNVLNISYQLSGKLNTSVTLNGEFSYTVDNQVISRALKPDVLEPSSSGAISSVNKPVVPDNTAKTSTQAKQTMVFFSVQIGAFLKSRVTTSYFSRKYGIGPVIQENHDNYRKFYYGDFDEYKQARDYRELIKTKGVQDAFVIAHKNNIRITVQEALMITNQKWYP